MTNAGVIDVNNHARLTVLGNVVNSGSIDLTHRGEDLLVGPGVTLSGGGTIVLSNGAAIGGAYPPGDSLTNVDNTISGAGNITEGRMALVNEAGGVIDATGAKNGLVIDTFNESFVNAGLIEATGAGGLSLSYSTINGTGGTILAGPGSKVTLLETDIAGGTLATAGDGVILAEAARLDGAAQAVTLAGHIDLYQGSRLTLAGMIVNTGSIDLLGGSHFYPTEVLIDAVGATLRGGGMLNLNGGGYSVVTGAAPGARLTNAGDTISGSGQLGKGSLSLVNGSTSLIEATGPAPLTIDTGALTITNDGVLEAVAGQLLVASPVGGSGRVIVDGGTAAFAAAFNEHVNFDAGGGTLELAHSQTFTAPVSGFSRHGATTLVLGDINFVSAGEASYSGTAGRGVLTVTDGAHTAHITLLGDYLNTTFVVSRNGSGVAVTDQAAATPSPHPLVAAMAGLGAAAAAPPHATAEAWRQERSWIVTPRPSIA